MKTFLTILGCGSSMGVPRADGFWGSCDKNNKKNYRTRSSALISRGNNNVLIDTSPDLRFQLLKNKVKYIESLKPQIISTGNIGCITQIANGTNIPILHTIELLDWYTGGSKPKILNKL